jgi:hypothetical protein
MLRMNFKPIKNRPAASLYCLRLSSFKSWPFPAESKAGTYERGNLVYTYQPRTHNHYRLIRTRQLPYPKTHHTTLSRLSLSIPVFLLLIEISRRVRTLLPDLLSLKKEPNWHRHQNKRNAAQQRACPLDTHPFEHVRRKQGKNGAEKGTKEGVGGDGGRGKLQDIRLVFVTEMGTWVERRGTYHKIRINQIIQRLQKDKHDTGPTEQSAQRRRNPVHFFPVPRPAEPEQTYGE